MQTHKPWTFLSYLTVFIEEDQHYILNNILLMWTWRNFHPDLVLKIDDNFPSILL